MEQSGIGKSGRFLKMGIAVMETKSCTNYLALRHYVLRGDS